MHTGSVSMMVIAWQYIIILLNGKKNDNIWSVPFGYLHGRGDSVWKLHSYTTNWKKHGSTVCSFQFPAQKGWFCMESTWLSNKLNEKQQYCRFLSVTYTEGVVLYGIYRVIQQMDRDTGTSVLTIPFSYMPGGGGSVCNLQFRQFFKAY